MEKNKYLALLLIIIFSLNSCKEKNNTDDNCGDGDYSCIQVTDNNGAILSGCTILQWHTNYELTESEKAIFQEKEDLATTGFVDAELSGFVFYPNPFTDVGLIDFNINNPSILHVAIINENCEIINDHLYEYQIIVAGTNQILFNLEDLAVGNYRLYYSLSKEGEQHYTGGFGNIQKQ